MLLGLFWYIFFPEVDQRLVVSKHLGKVHKCSFTHFNVFFDIFRSFYCVFSFLQENMLKDGKRRFSTNQKHAKHPFAGRTMQQMTFCKDKAKKSDFFVHRLLRSSWLTWDSIYVLCSNLQQKKSGAKFIKLSDAIFFVDVFF